MKMKTTIIAFLIAFVFAVEILTPFVITVDYKEQFSAQEAVFIFPASLEMIEEEAFEGTAAAAVVFPHGLQTIEDSAFGDAGSLTAAYLPETISYIADDAFAESEDFVIHGVSRSAAREWADKHRIPFVHHNIWNEILPVEQELALRGAIVDSTDVIVAEPAASIRPSGEERTSKRPQDRPELTPVDYWFP